MKQSFTMDSLILFKKCQPINFYFFPCISFKSSQNLSKFQISHFFLSPRFQFKSAILDTCSPLFIDRAKRDRYAFLRSSSNWKSSHYFCILQAQWRNRIRRFIAAKGRPASNMQSGSRRAVT